MHGKLLHDPTVLYKGKFVPQPEKTFGHYTIWEAQKSERAFYCHWAAFLQWYLLTQAIFSTRGKSHLSN